MSENMELTSLLMLCPLLSSLIRREAVRWYTLGVASR